MIRTTSISDFINSLPLDISKSVSKYLRFRFLSKEEIIKSLDTLNSRGMLGLLPFGREEIADNGMEIEPGIFALRIFAGKELDEASVVICMEKKVVTIASRLRFFVPGMIVFLKTNGYADTLTDQEILEVTKFAELLGESELIPSLLKSFGIQGDEFAGSENMLRYFKEYKKVFEGLEDDQLIAKNAEIMCTVMHFQNTEDDIHNLVHQYPKHLDVWIQYLLYHCNNNTTKDISETLWKIFQGDYLGDPYAEILFLKEFTNLIGQKKALDKRLLQLSEQHQELIQERPSLWSAVLEFIANPLNYDGRAHLQFAKELEEYDSYQAYRQTINSAYFSGRLLQKELYDEARNFIKKLAQNYNWRIIEELMEYETMAYT